MSGPPDALALTTRLALLSSISFGGFPTVLPDVREFVVQTHGWVTDQEFSNFFALAQAIPGPNMILMMSFIGWQVWGLPGAIASAFATFGPPCTMYFASYWVWDRFREAPFQEIVRSGLVPVTIGLVIAGGVVMAGASGTGFGPLLVTASAALLLLWTRINPLLLLLGGGILGTLDLF
jgi:chromate transporter